MGIHVIKMPDIGEGIAEVELAEWHVKPGDSVVEDQLLADVMTEKATVEVPSPVVGTVVSLGGEVGEVMAVGSELIRIEVEGEGNIKEGAGDAGRRSQPTKAAVAHAASQSPASAGVADLHPEGVSGAKPSLRPASAQAFHEKPVASPAVRRRARELGVDLETLAGSGTSGRITHEDLDAAARGAPALAPGHSGKPALAYIASDDEQRIPIIGLRRKIAQKMQESKRRIPHFTYVEEIDVTEIENLRVALNKKWGQERGKLTLLPFLIRAMVLALREHPQINARYDDENDVVTRYGAVHMGIAAQTDAGLMAPVLRHAEALDLWSCAAEINRLAEAARTGKATRDELSGSTITISSLGPLGGIMATPVINHPEVGIVGVNRIVERPVFRGSEVVARKMMNLSSSFDHRVVDGLHAAEFIQAVRHFLETPALLFIE